MRGYKGSGWGREDEGLHKGSGDDGRKEMVWIPLTPKGIQ